MREAQLVGLLIQMGVDRGLDIEQAADQISGATLPVFVDDRALREAIIGEVESHLRSQMEQRLQLMRRRFEVGEPAGASAPVVQPTPAPVTGAASQTDLDESRRSKPRLSYTPPAAELATAPVRKGEVGPEAEPNGQPAVDQVGAEVAPEEEEMPTDATMVWTTRHG